MKPRRVLVLMHADCVPPKSVEGLTPQQMIGWQMEYDILSGLGRLGHEVRVSGVRDDVETIQQSIVEWKPEITFNVLEEFHGVPLYDQAVASLLELMRQPYTGCNPRGLAISRDKALTKKILYYHRIRVPEFAAFAIGKPVKMPKRLHFPLLVKSATEEGSVGISQASIVASEDKLKERVEFVHDHLRTDALAEEYIEGRELYVGVIGNNRLESLPVWEMLFTKPREDVARIATQRVKWDLAYQTRHGIMTAPAQDLPDGFNKYLSWLSKRIYRVLGLSGYARLDFRLTERGRVYLLEANPNPHLGEAEDFAQSAKHAGVSYDELLQRIIDVGFSYRAPWQAAEIARAERRAARAAAAAAAEANRNHVEAKPARPPESTTPTETARPT